MNNINDRLAGLQDGQMAGNLARIYGISPEQAQQAVDAVLPAFQLGLERSAQTQAGMLGLIGTMARNPYAQAAENTGFGFSPQMREQGNDALAAMFGSPDVSRAVAAQAAATSGLSSALIKQMLPVIASLVLGSLMKGGGASGGGSNPLQDLLGGMFGGGAGGAGAGQPRSGGSGNPLEDLLGGMFGGGAGGGQPRPGGGSNPLQDLLGGMFGGGAGGAGAGQPRSGGSGNPLEDLLGGMLGGGAGGAGGGQPRSSGGGNPLEDLLGGMFGGGGAGGSTTPSEPEAEPRPRSADPKMQPFQDIFDQFFDPRSGGRR
ncbi:DUF937 domain-containing protein [Ancylobacter gelatini]|uniref:DUF937 domain-containing protein n=1 Tax=Ancylobacter gelatini TaxID=2919920 RepID=UPI002478C25C|nr:DUF937 domain-containing protein [Ancylobacter gelatini]